MPSLLAAIQLALAQKQAQDQQAAQQPPPGALSQLSQILATRRAAQQAQQPAAYADPGSIPTPQPSPDQPRYIRPTVSAGPSTSIARGILNGQQAADRLNNQDQLAQFRADQADQRLQERNDQQTMLEQLRSADEEARAAQHDLPPQVIQGLQSGHLQYSQAQQRQLQDLQASIDKVDSDPRFSPLQRAQFKAKQLGEIRRISMSPQMVPPDKWPVPPEQQLAQQTVMKPVQLDPSDPSAVLNLPMVPVQRAGGVKWELTPDGEAQKEIAILHLKQRQQLELEHIKTANKPDPFVAQHQKDLQARQKAMVDALKQRKPTTKEFTTLESNPEDPTKKKAVVDYAAYTDALDKWQADYERASSQQFVPTLDGMTGQHDSFDALAAHAGLLSPDSPQPQPISDAAPQDMPAPAPTLSDHPEDGQSQWNATPIGAVVTLPDGRTVRKTGDTSFEPVQ